MSGAANNNRKGDSGRSEKAVAWQTAIGLQAADGLSASEFIYQLSQKHVNGKISIDQAAEQLNHYYFEKNSHDAADPVKSLDITMTRSGYTFRLSSFTVTYTDYQWN